MNIKHIFDIAITTIRMKPPIILDNNKTKRKPEITNEIIEKLILHETFLRRSAYKNTSIKTGESFFDDSDMKSEYYLVVVYDQNLNMPLLSARYFFDKTLIEKSLKGDDNINHLQTDLSGKLNLNDFKEGEIFLADRLSGNVYNSTYRQNRNYIFSLFYAEILTYNKNRSLILMARKEKHDKLLKKYLRLNFNIIGSIIHKGKEHWIILTDLKKSIL